MSATMNAYRMVDWGRPPELVEVPVPAPGTGQVLVRVAGCGLCRSDLTMRAMPRAVGERLGWSVPFTLGHEVGGWVAATGAGSSGVKEGDAVAVVSSASCGTCWYCLRGMDNCCPRGMAGRGYGRDGGLAGYVLVDQARSLVRLSRVQPRTAGPLTDAGATAYHAVRRALPRIAPGGTAVVLGVGGLGAFAVQFLRLLTAARVVAVDTSEQRRGYAQELGAHEAVPGVGESTRDDLRAVTGPRGADAVLDFVGTEETIGVGCASVRAGGAFGLVGSGGGRLAAAWFSGLPRDGEVFTFQGGTVADVHEVVALADAGLIRNDIEELAMRDVEDAYARLAAGTLPARAVIVPDGT